MTLSKLSLRNAKRQARDYLVYFVTVVLSAALLYAFNGLVFSREIRELSDKMASLPLMIVLASIVVVCIIGWLVSYSTKFILSRRSREMGTYILIGLTNRQVAKLFFLENLVMGGCSLALGTALGSLLYQALRAIVLALFGRSYRFSLALSLPAAGLTAAYFILIYLHSLRKSRKRIRSMKIYDLIYFDRLNESAVIRTGKKRRWIFTASIVLGLLGTLLLMAGDLLFGLIGAGCIIAFLFGFFLSFASGVPAFFEKRPAKKYRGQNLLIFRTLTAKLGTMGIVMATISLLFTATLISEGTGMTFSSLFRGRAANYVFDLIIGISSPHQDHSPYLEYIDENIPVESSLQYRIYLSDNNRIVNYLKERTDFPYGSGDNDLLMRYSDYAALRAMLGYPDVSLEPGTCLIHCMAYLESTLEKYDSSVTISGNTLEPGDIHTEPFCQHGWDGNGDGFLLIVPDELAEKQPAARSLYAAQTREPVTEEQFAALRAIRNDDMRPDYDMLHASSDEEAEVAALTAMTVFPLYYLALILTITAAAILTIQQLAETDRYRRQFILLRKLGMDRRDMTRALGRQFALYYAMPAVPPMLIGVPFILNMGAAVEPGILVASNSPGALVAFSLALFFLIYAIYILLAYTGLKRNVIPD